MPKSTWTFPINGTYHQTQGFGEGALPYPFIPSGKHDGYDFGSPRGTPIVAPDAGVITKTYELALPGQGGYGNEIRILTNADQEGFFYDHVFGHLLKVFVKLGDKVVRGQLLGLINSTGYSSGDHLHWGVRLVKQGTTLGMTTKVYLNDIYTLMDYDNMFYGYFDHGKLFKDSPKEIYPVDNRYNQPYSPTREWLWKIRHEKYAKSRVAKALIPYDDRIMKAAVYGFWNIEVLIDPAMIAVYYQITKPEFERIKRLGRSEGWATDAR